MDLRETYNAIASDWHKDHEHDDWWVHGTTIFSDLLPQNGTVLDIGCGSGIKSSFLAKQGLAVTGIDFSDELLKIAKLTASDSTFIHMDMRDVSTLPMLFDGLFAQASLLHIPRTEVLDVVSSWLPKLKQNGFLYIAVKEVKQGRSLEEHLKEEDYGYAYERFFSYFTLSEIESLFKALHLEIVYTAQQTPNNRWIQIIGKKIST